MKNPDYSQRVQSSLGLYYLSPSLYHYDLSIRRIPYNSLTYTLW